MKSNAVLFIFLSITSFVYSQDRFLTVTSKDSVHNKPVFKSSLGANLKLNGYYDVFGGLQESETFNIGLINVFGTDDSSSFHMDMYQTQIKFETSYFQKNGREIKALVEFDFWGGNGKLRLRKAFIEFGQWQIGQNWNNFGDEVIWPNIMEWEGPPSGIWVRSPHIKYFNTFKNEDWIYELSIEAPISDYNRFPEVEPLVEEANQNIPDFTFAIKYKKDWGHMRLSSIIRSINYKLDGDMDNFLGYGFSFSGIYKTLNKNNFQYQIVAGKGITAYMTSIAGLGYDGFPTGDQEFNATPSFGGWASYEYFLTKKLHSNFVLGYTNFELRNLERYILTTGSDIQNIVLAGNVKHNHYYGIFNFMYDAYERMTIGLELDYGVKKLTADGHINDFYSNNAQSRDALRVSFGFMFYF